MLYEKIFLVTDGVRVIMTNEQRLQGQMLVLLLFRAIMTKSFWNEPVLGILDLISSFLSVKEYLALVTASSRLWNHVKGSFPAHLPVVSFRGIPHVASDRCIEHFRRFLHANVEKLVLRKCTSLSDNVMSAIADRCPKLANLDLSDTPAGYRHFLQLRQLPIRKLDLSFCSLVNDGTLECLSYLPLLSLSLKSCRNIIGPGIRFLKDMPLEELNLGGCVHIHDPETFTYFRTMNLRKLDLHKTHTENPSCLKELSHISTLRFLNLSGTSLSSIAGLRGLKLTHLYLSYCLLSQKDFFEVVHDMPLKSLDLSFVRLEKIFPSDGVIPKMPQLETLNLDHIGAGVDDVLKLLRICPNLTDLDLSNSNIEFRHVDSLQLIHPKLRVLKLTGCSSFTSSAVLKLQGLPLRELDLRFTDIDDSTIELLNSAALSQENNHIQPTANKSKRRRTQAFVECSATDKRSRRASFPLSQSPSTPDRRKSFTAIAQLKLNGTPFTPPKPALPGSVLNTGRKMGME